MDLKQFRTKSVIVTAEQWFPGKEVEGVTDYDPNSSGRDEPYPAVRTPRGPQRIEPGEWVVTEPGFGRYICAPGPFKEFYEPVDGTPETKLSETERALLQSQEWPDAADRIAFAEHRVEQAERVLQQIQETIQTEVAGNPLVTVEKIPEWLVGFLIVCKSADDERLGQIKSLTRELWLANEKLRAGGAVEEEVAPAFSTYAQLDAAVDEIAEAAREYEEFKKKETEGLLIGGSEGQVLDSTGEYRDATADEIAEAARDYDPWKSRT